MTLEGASKVKPEHLERTAMSYVRQSSLRQVQQNTESARRQYSLRDSAVVLGWPPDRVETIDVDQGRSGASSANRVGFQRLVSEVSLGKVGIVMGLEVSRLARNNADFQRLLELCAMTNTLVLEENRVFDPNDINDSVILGFKGQMSQMELSILKSRLRGGILSKARRGVLKVPLPVGFVYREDKSVALHPDARVRDALRHLFRTFDRLGTTGAVVKECRSKGLLFPRAIRQGPRKGEIGWSPIDRSMVLQVLHHPVYAGAFCYGRRRLVHLPEGRHGQRSLPRKEWVSLVKDAHVGYITWENYEANERRILENGEAAGRFRRRCSPREGPALLQGLGLCGRCGASMSVRYHYRGVRILTYYVCSRAGSIGLNNRCLTVYGSGLDESVGQLLLQSVTPLTLEVALQVEHEVEQKWAEADRMRRQHVERARYEADMARRRYMSVDPGNRLVAGALEAEWNEKMRTWQEAQETYEKDRKVTGEGLSALQKEQICALARDFPRVWNDPRTPILEKKRMARLLLQDVTLNMSDRISAKVRFRGGATHELDLPRPLSPQERYRHPAEVVSMVDRLLDDHSEADVAEILNAKGFRPGRGVRYNYRIVARVRRTYRMKTRFERLRAKGFLTHLELAAKYGVTKNSIWRWRRDGLIRGAPYGGHRNHLYEPHVAAPPGSRPAVTIAARAAQRTNGSREPQKV